MGRSFTLLTSLVITLVLERRSLPDPPIHTYSAMVLPSWSRSRKRGRMQGSSSGSILPIVPYTSPGFAMVQQLVESLLMSLLQA